MVLPGPNQVTLTSGQQLLYQLIVTQFCVWTNANDGGISLYLNGGLEGYLEVLLLRHAVLGADRHLCHHGQARQLQLHGPIDRRALLGACDLDHRRRTAGHEGTEQLNKQRSKHGAPAAPFGKAAGAPRLCFRPPEGS